MPGNESFFKNGKNQLSQFATVQLKAVLIGEFNMALQIKEPSILSYQTMPNPKLYKFFI
jgi:hypothetical protein